MTRADYHRADGRTITFDGYGLRMQSAGPTVIEVARVESDKSGRTIAYVNLAPGEYVELVENPIPADA